MDNKQIPEPQAMTPVQPDPQPIPVDARPPRAVAQPLPPDVRPPAPQPVLQPVLVSTPSTPAFSMPPQQIPTAQQMPIAQPAQVPPATPAPSPTPKQTQAPVDVSALFQKDPEPVFAPPKKSLLKLAGRRRTALLALLPVLLLMSGTGAALFMNSTSKGVPPTADKTPVSGTYQEIKTATADETQAPDQSQPEPTPATQPAPPPPSPASQPAPLPAKNPTPVPAPAPAPSPAPTPAPPPPTYHTVMHWNSCFSPNTVTIERGDIVTFKNGSTHDMWPASDSHPSHSIYPEFDAKTSLGKNATYSVYFGTPGTWNYHDHNRPKCTGTVVVK